MVATGNDFVVVEDNPVLNTLILKDLARKVCDRKYGIGADGLLVLGRSKRADIRMRIFNADGSEAQMCGNGARCAALYTKRLALTLETKAGIIESLVRKDNVKIKLTPPNSLKLGVPVEVNGFPLKTNFINTGVPHAVIFVEGLNKIDVATIGRQVRYNKEFSPRGANVDFVEVSGNDSLNVRTYERGVEDETLACGTGSVAAALIFGLLSSDQAHCKINVRTKSGETLKIYFDKKVNSFSNVWLEGKAGIVYKGEYYV